MYTWYLKLHMKSGKILTGYIKSNDETSDEVANRFLAGDIYKINGIKSVDNKSNILFKIGEIEACEISPYKFD